MDATCKIVLSSLSASLPMTVAPIMHTETDISSLLSELPRAMRLKSRLRLLLLRSNSEIPRTNCRDTRLNSGP